MQLAPSFDPARALAARLTAASESRLAAAKYIAIAVPDRTRPTDTVAALHALRRRLPATAHITVVVGLGMHRPLSDDELGPLQEAAANWSVLQHDPSDVVRIGEANGVPCTLFRPMTQADCVIAVGTVALHQYAGFSGGHKAVSVGCAGAETLDVLHARDWVCHPEVQVGRLKGNPFREAVDALGRHARCIAGLMQLPDGRWVWDEADTVVQRAAATLTPWRIVDRPFDRVILRVDPTHASNFYQASRAATYLALSPNPPLTPGAELQLHATCSEGVGNGRGELAFRAVWESWRDRQGALLNTPNPPSGAGCQRAFMLARCLQRTSVSIWGTDRVEALQDFGFPAHAEAPPEGSDALVIDAPFEQLPQLARR